MTLREIVAEILELMVEEHRTNYYHLAPTISDKSYDRLVNLRIHLEESE